MTSVVCGSCEFEGIHTNARKWCTNCEEGLCQECENSHKANKASRGHKLMSVEDYLKIADVKINQICEHHQKRFDLFCKTHDVAICVECFPSHHKACPDVVALDKVTKNAKQSTALDDLERTINEALQNVKHCIANRETAIKSFAKQEQEIRKTIKETRMIINNHMDKLEQALLNNLTINYENCKSYYESKSKQLKATEDFLNKLKCHTLQLKQIASDIQVFLGTRQISKSVDNAVESTNEVLKALKNYELELKVDSVIYSLVKDVTQFGNVKITENPANLFIREAKIDQAQTPIHEVTTNPIQDIRLELKQRFTIKQGEQGTKIHVFTGCLMLPDNRLLIADRWVTGKLMEYNDKGQHIRDIKSSNRPFDLTAIDSDEIAVSYPGLRHVDLINIKNNVVLKKIGTKGRCYGISYQGERLYVVVRGQGIVVTDKTGSILNTIKCDVSTVCHLHTSKDTIFYTDFEKNTVHCCNMLGEEIWIFNDESVIRPQGVSIDNNQNVFVVGQFSNTLTIIQHDGTVSKTLLKESNGLDHPFAVYFNKNNNSLVLSDKPGSLALYNVI